ncbi:MAG: LysR family transcriptional regulator [Gammaproteobacteria bacterium]|nr:LysR family transcriptional regulator [Gammaproteobacteria bacterium]
MDWRSVNFDWNHARAFLVTAEEGSLTAAAKSLGLTQPTLGRQVSLLEKELGVALFERVGKGLELTPSGVELLQHVRAMGEAAGSLSLSASGQSQAIEGNVCISATDLMTILAMPQWVAKLRQQQPHISIELIASNTESDLKRREADIAIRGVQPTQADLIARQVGFVTAHIYGAVEYVQHLGSIESPQDLQRADFICNKPQTIIDILKNFSIELSTNQFPVYSESVITQWHLVKQGLGLALLPDQLAEFEPAFVKVLPELQVFRAPIWLVVHRELRMNRRVRAVYDFLVEELSNKLGSENNCF